jgi:hypothetical protein
MDETISNETRFLHAVEFGLGAWQWGDRLIWQYGQTHTDEDAGQRSKSRWQPASALWIPPKSTAAAVPSVCWVSS